MICCLFQANYRDLWCERMFLKTHNKPFMPLCACWCVFVSPMPSSVTLMWTNVLLFPFPTTSTHHHQSWNLKSSIVQPVSNSWHYCQCQSSIEAACFCSAKWERIPVALTDGLLPSDRTDNFVVVCFFFLHSTAVGTDSNHIQQNKNNVSSVSHTHCSIIKTRIFRNLSHSCVVISKTGLIWKNKEERNMIMKQMSKFHFHIAKTMDDWLLLN